VLQDASNLYLAMEFHAGGDLLSLIQRMGSRLEETAVRFYTAEVLINFFIVLSSVVDPESLNPDPDPGFWWPKIDEKKTI
jgi:hypothetical protein